MTRGRLALGLTIAALVPVLAVLATRTGSSYLPGGDVAYIDLRVRNLFDDFPLIGVYSRYGWSHPGPILFYALAPLHHLFGNATWTTLVGGALIQGIAIAAAARVAWRRGGLTLVGLVLAGILLAYVALGHLAFLTAWNPYVAFPYFALFLLLLWSVAAGDRLAVIGLAVVASVLVQLHVGYAPLVAAGGAWLVAALLQNREEVKQGGWRGPVIGALATGFLLWLPAIVEELTTDPGNLTRLVRYARESHAIAGVETGAGLLSAQFRVVPPWLGGSDLTDSLSGTAKTASLGWLALPVLALAIAWFIGRRARSRSALQLTTLMGVLLAAGVFALSRVDGLPESYLFFWRALLATFVAVSLGWAIAVSRPSFVGERARRLALGCLSAAVVVPALVLTVDVASHADEVNPFEDQNRALINRVAATAEAERPFIVRDAGTEYRGLSGALVNELDRSGAPVRLDVRLAHVVGDDWTARPEDVDSVWYVAENGTDVSLLIDEPRASVLARTTPLNKRHERELVRLQRTIAARLLDAGRADLLPALEYSVFASLLEEVPGIDQASINRLRVLNGKVERSERCRCAVVAFPPDVTPPTIVWEPRPAP